MKLVFAGTPDFAATILAGLLNAQHEVIAVYTQPDRAAGRGHKLRASPVKALAEAHDIAVFQPANLRDEDAQKQFQALQADAMIVAAYGLILPPKVLAMPSHGCINVHASLLPRWRGAAPIQRAIEAGDTQSGICIMQMEKGLDTGPVLAREMCEISDQDTAGTLHDRLAAMGSALLLTTLSAVEDGSAIASAQDDANTSYAHRFDKSDARIDWSASATVIQRHIRAYNPAPGAWTEINRDPALRLRILRSQVDELSTDTQQSEGSVGKVIKAQDDQLVIACGQGSLAIEELQIAGKRMLSAREFNNAKSLQSGEVLL